MIALLIITGNLWPMLWCKHFPGCKSLGCGKKFDVWGAIKTAYNILMFYKYVAFVLAHLV